MDGFLLPIRTSWTCSKQTCSSGFSDGASRLPGEETQGLYAAANWDPGISSLGATETVVVSPPICLRGGKPMLPGSCQGYEDDLCSVPFDLHQNVVNKWQRSKSVVHVPYPQ